MVLTARKTESKLVVGEGEQTFEVHHDWPQLPDSFTWQTTHNVAVDKTGNLYVIHEGRKELKDHPAIFVFDPEGKYIRSFGNQFQGGGHGIEIRDEGGQEFLTCFDANSGDVAWKEGHQIKKAADYPGTRATPTVEGEHVYTLGEAGDLTCRTLADGKEVWRTNVLSETGARMLGWGCASSPLIVGERIFVQTGEGGPIAVAVDKSDGKVIWKSQGTSKAGFASLVQMPGAGLGLTISREIVRRAGGDITIANRPGGGLIQIVELPATVA